MMPEKINYYDISMETLSHFRPGRKPSLLIHCCCGPCSCFPLSVLPKYFDVTVFYNNSNIYPEAEFAKRLLNLRTLISYLKRDYGHDIKLIVPPYDNVSYNHDLEPFKDEPEGGKRCLLCYRKRMAEAYDYAEKEGYDYFTTVMTISRQKNSQILNQIGRELEEKHSKTKYFYSDFKKKDGALKGKAIREHYELYNQVYCGCVYSYWQGIDRILAAQAKEEEKK